MHRRFASLLFCLLATNAMAQTTREDSLTRSELSQKCEAAIDDGTKFLLDHQNADGSWAGGNPTDREGGHTALVTLALISSGESPQSASIARAIKFLKTAQPQKAIHATYCVGLRACVYAQLPDPTHNVELRADLRWLEDTMIDHGDRRGMYDYNKFGGLGGDFSNSQYGVLGVWYAAQSGLEVPRSYWRQVENAWKSGQSDDGGWGYMPGDRRSYASMTAAGAVTLLITNDYLNSRDEVDLMKVIVNKPLDDAMKWLGNNFAVDVNSGRDTTLGQKPTTNEGGVLDAFGRLGFGGGSYVNYMLFGYERVGEASGLTNFGTHKWFDEGADYLVRAQAADGSWTGTDGAEIDTAYALLFLSRGRAPVVMQKLQFDGRWDNRSRDVASFTYFMRRATERHVNWQIVSIDASPEELREAPLLYVASDRDLNLNGEQKQKLKTYIEQGGLLVCVNEGKTDDFTRSVIAIGAEIFPAYKFADVPRDHPIYTANFPVKTPIDPIRGLSNGVRELIVLYPGEDMSWKWQSIGGAFVPKNSPYATLANLSLYVTDRANPRYKGEDTWIDADATKSKRSVSVARIIYDGNWNPEPAGWQRLANYMHNSNSIDLQIEPTDHPTNQKLAHVTAANAFQLSFETQNALRKYLDGGDFLLLDAAGGSAEAAGALEGLLRQMYPSVVIAPLPLDHPIYRAKTFGGKDIDHVTYRRSVEIEAGDLPRLRGASVNGKLVAILSNEDLSGGLVGYPTAGLNGYSPVSAIALMRNIILWRASK
jgi:hypothetical protein